MSSVRVTWEIDLDLRPGESHREAAQRIANLYFQPRIAAGQVDTACVFTVREKNGTPYTIDLSEK